MKRCTFYKEATLKHSKTYYTVLFCARFELNSINNCRIKSFVLQTL